LSIVSILPSVALTPCLLYPFFTATLVVGGFFVLGAILLVVFMVHWVVPAVKKAIHLNLNTARQLHTFQETLLRRFAASFLVQVFLLALFIYPALMGQTNHLPGRYASNNHTIDLYAGSEGPPIFVEFALPSWYYGIFLSSDCGSMPLLLTLVEGSGTFEAARSTGMFSSKIATVMIMWYVVVLCCAIQLPNMILSSSANAQNQQVRSHLSALDGMTSGWNTFGQISMQILSVMEFLLLFLSMQLLQSIAKMTEELKAGNTWHFFLSHKQANGGDQVSVLSAQLKQRGW